MQLTELLFQRVKELGAQGSLALKPGYVAIVSKSSTIKAALVASLFPGPDDQRLLADGTGSTRVGVGLTGKDGQPYRMLRELGAGRFLHKFDPAQKKFVSLTEDDLEISSFLRVECELPTPDSYAGFFVLDAHELPSQRKAASTATAAPVVNQEKVRQLKAELEQTKDFEQAQDKLYKVTSRLQELQELGGKVDAAERELATLEQQVSRSVFTPAQIKELTGRAQRAQTDRQKHLDALADVGAQADKLEEETPPLPDTLMRDPLLWGGIAGGLAIDGVSFLMKAPLLAVVGLVPYFGSLLAALRWIDAHEAAEGTEAQIKRLREREEQMKKTFAEDQAPLKAALKTAKVESPEELVELFKHRDEQLRLRDQAAERLARLREEPELAAIAEERPRLMEEKQVLELTVASQGFARGVSEIENDLKRELGLTAPEPAKDQKKNTADDGSDAKKLFERAAELLGTTPAELMTAVAPRLSAYLTALTDKKLASAKMDPAGMVFLLAADGRGGPYATAPQPMKDQGYLAMRLALLERVIGAKKMPVFIDDTFASVDAAKKPLLAKMLKGLAQQTQVLHRVPEAPVAGVFDAVVQAPA